MYSREHLNSKTNRFGLLFLLLLVVVVVIIAAFFTFKNDNTQSADQSIKTGASGEKASTDGSQLHSDGVENQDFSNNKDPDGLIKVSGRIIELTNRAGGKWVKLSVEMPLTKSVQRETATNQRERREYRFFLSDKDTKGVKEIKGGEFVIVYSQQPPSEKDYIFAKKVEVKIET